MALPLKYTKSTGGSATGFQEIGSDDPIPGNLVSGLVGSNMLINCGAPVINQRAFAGGALAAGVYGYDRWKAGTGGCNITIDAAGVFSHASGPLVQVVEAPEAAWGVPVTLSVESPSGTISVNIGGATGSITAGAGRRSVTLTPTGSGSMIVQLTAIGTTYSQPRLERGAVATAPEYRNMGLELLLCQRYCKRFVYGAGDAFAAFISLNNTQGLTFFQFPAMRAKPAATMTGNFSVTGANGGTGVVASSVNLVPTGVDNIALIIAVPGTTAWTAGYIAAVTGGASLTLDAEF